MDKSRFGEIYERHDGNWWDCFSSYAWSSENQISFIKYMMEEHGFNITLSPVYDGWDILGYFCDENAKVVEWLLQNGANADPVNVNDPMSLVMDYYIGAEPNEPRFGVNVDEIVYLLFCYRQRVTFTVQYENDWTVKGILKEPNVLIAIAYAGRYDLLRRLCSVLDNRGLSLYTTSKNVLDGAVRGLFQRGQPFYPVELQNHLKVIDFVFHSRGFENQEEAWIEDAWHELGRKQSSKLIEYAKTDCGIHYMFYGRESGQFFGGDDLYSDSYRFGFQWRFYRLAMVLCSSRRVKNKKTMTKPWISLLSNDLLRELLVKIYNVV